MLDQCFNCGEEIDIDLSEKLKLEADAIFMFALKGLQRLHKQNKFTESTEVNNKLEEYKLDSNPVKQFMEEKYVVVEDENKGVKSNDLYNSYGLWCEENGFMKLNNVNFGKELKRLQYNKKQKKIGGKTVGFFEKLDKR